MNISIKNKYLNKPVRIKQMGTDVLAIAEGTIIGIYLTITDLYKDHPHGTHKEWKSN